MTTTTTPPSPMHESTLVAELVPEQVLPKVLTTVGLDRRSTSSSSTSSPARR